VDFVTGKEAKNLYDIQEDIELGNEVYKELSTEMKEGGAAVNRDAKQVRVLQEMLRRISSVSHLPDLPYSVTLFHTNLVNAFALPGGKVAVFEGLYSGEDRLVEGEDEMAAVIAHEVAHVTCRHSTEEMTRSLPVELVLGGAAIFAELDENEDLEAILGGAFVLYEGVISTKYSRADEEEADAVGLDYMARAGYDPSAAVRLWRRAHDKEGSEPKWINYLSTHPRNKDRARNLEKLLPEVLPIYERTRGGNLEPVPRVPNGGEEAD
jgi:predicted Zn-dependent protease